MEEMQLETQFETNKTMGDRWRFVRNNANLETDEKREIQKKENEIAAADKTNYRIYEYTKENYMRR
jgi:hypothetical protein